MIIKLIRPAIEHKKEALEFREEFFGAGEKVINGGELLDQTEIYEEWLSSVKLNANPDTVSPEWVLTDTFFAVDEAGKIIGIIDFRHELKGFLVDFGHCGYSVRPSERRKGYATKMLALVIEVARTAKLSSLQLSVERSNTPSIRTITKNGGVLERSFDFEGETADVYRIGL